MRLLSRAKQRLSIPPANANRHGTRFELLRRLRHARNTNNGKAETAHTVVDSIRACASSSASYVHVSWSAPSIVVHPRCRRTRPRRLAFTRAACACLHAACVHVCSVDRPTYAHAAVIDGISARKSRRDSHTQVPAAATARTAVSGR